MPLFIIRNDLTQMHTDAIVTPANETLTAGRGTSASVFHAAGEQLLTDACRAIGHCPAGEAVITPGFGLRARYIIHAVCPAWQGGNFHEQETLVQCYQAALKLAKKRRLKSVAFPLLSSGFYGYPKEEAFTTAVEAVRDFLLEEDLDVYLVLYDHDSVAVSKKLSVSIDEYIDDHYVEQISSVFEEAAGPVPDWASDPKACPVPASRPTAVPKPTPEACPPAASQPMPESHFAAAPKPTPEARFTTAPMSESRSAAAPKPAPKSCPPVASRPAPAACPAPASRPAAAFSASPKGHGLPRFSLKKVRSLQNLDQRLAHLDETFSQMLLRLIDERGLKDSVVYRRANIDRRLFSKIRSNADYSPTKRTVLAFAISLELPPDETRKLLMKAGYALSNSSKSDVIISYFIENRIYDIFQINEVLFAYGQPILGQ